ncbi:hypothetical protein E4U35_001438 [Claviceps purpurea]|nr:hypothetical protein E4U35_001438 [Claviceps purpurea]KAG6264240.1 hypothetical protein E4U49_001801 [Claviceps purpurea]
MFCLRRQVHTTGLFNEPPSRSPAHSKRSIVKSKKPSLTSIFSLNSWLPLLFIPTNASPAFIFLFFICTYFLNRPCVYCSILLLILFFTSCNWSDRCFLDVRSNWFLPRPPKVDTVGAATRSADDVDAAALFNATVVDMAKALAGAAADDMAAKRAEWTGLGLEWLRTWLGKREWRIECMDIAIQL